MPHHQSSKYYSIVICTFIAVFIATPSQADTINVPADFPTIQAGIDAAANGDEVVVADGIYTGEGNKNISFNGKSITVRSLNGANACIIDLEGNGEGFGFLGQIPDQVVDGFTIRNGNGIANAIFVGAASPTIQNCIFLSNHTTFGGAIYLNDSQSTIINCQFVGNSSNANGGGLLIVAGSDVHVTNCDFGDNSTITGFGSAMSVENSTVVATGCNFNNNQANVGGAIYNLNSTLSADGCTFTGNDATLFGGAITNDNSDTTATECDFDSNTAGAGGGACATSSGSSIEAILCNFFNNSCKTGDGGAMFNLGVPATTTDCTYSDNTANRGGAIYNSQCNLQSTNSLYNGNTATNSGGAIYNSQSQPQIRLATMWGNSAPAGGGLYNISSFPNISNSILNHNSPNQIIDISGSFTTVTYSNVQGGWAGDGNINQNPMFVDPNNGDFNLAPGSSCIDAGNNAAVPSRTGSDLVGNPRFVDDPKTIDTGLGAPPLVDMGAIEFQVLLLCPWDLDSSGAVGISDLLALFAQWGGPGTADFDESGTVNTNDLLILFANWGPCK